MGRLELMRPKADNLFIFCFPGTNYRFAGVGDSTPIVGDDNGWVGVGSGVSHLPYPLFLGTYCIFCYLYTELYE